jgi:hypothetical protein
MLIGKKVEGWVGIRVAHFEFIGDEVDGNSLLFNLNI